MKRLFIATVIIASALAACKTTKKTAEAPKPVALDCSKKTFTYTADIKPLMAQYCTGCHNTNEKAGYNFLQLEFVKKAATNGHLLGTIKHAEGFDAMPPRGEKLEQATIDMVECWIKNGMKE